VAPIEDVVELCPLALVARDGGLWDAVEEALGEPGPTSRFDEEGSGWVTRSVRRTAKRASRSGSRVPMVVAMGLLGSVWVGEKGFSRGCAVGLAW
jgi:hypothetical protein